MDINEELLERGISNIGRSLDRLVEVHEKSGGGFSTWEKFKASGVNPDIPRYRIG